MAVYIYVIFYGVSTTCQKMLKHAEMTKNRKNKQFLSELLF